MSDALKSNTTLANLYLWSEYKGHRWRHQQITLFNLVKLTVSKIGDTGAKSLSEALKSNTTLTALYLYGKDKRIWIYVASTSKSLLSLYIRINRERDRKYRSNIIE